MLKIKEDKMQELEKFGFTKIHNYEPNKLWYNGKYLGGVNLHIDLKTRKICFNLNTGGVWKKIDLLFDLIQAGLVEKVG